MSAPNVPDATDSELSYLPTIEDAVLLLLAAEDALAARHAAISRAIERLGVDGSQLPKVGGFDWTDAPEELLRSARVGVETLLFQVTERSADHARWIGWRRRLDAALAHGRASG